MSVEHDKQVSHWEQVKRCRGTALEFCQKARQSYSASPQAGEPAVTMLFTLLEMALRDHITFADRMIDAAIACADEAAAYEARATKGGA